MRFIPAIDLLDGRCVRLLKGDFRQVTVYHEDPVAVARGFAAAGATRLHVVDLDAARDAGDNRAHVRAIVEGAGVEVQVGGGLRDEAAVAELLAAGAHHAVIGTLAAENPSAARAIAARWPGRVYVGIDGRGGQVATHGWERDGGVGTVDIIEAYRDTPLAGFIATDIDRDGTMAGTDGAALRALVQSSPHPVILSGGVADLSDVVAAREAGAWGVIAGRAVYEGALDVSEAVAAAGG